MNGEGGAFGFEVNPPIRTWAAGYRPPADVLLADLDDSLCDALMALRHGKYDGMTAETHLEHLIKRVRAARVPSTSEGEGA